MKTGYLNPIIYPRFSDNRKGILNQMSMKEIFHEACTGLTYIHSKKDDDNDYITHRDIKPENILVVPLKRDTSYAIKFSDFDCSKQLEIGHNVIISSTPCTERYRDPYIANKKSVKGEVTVEDYLNADVYALGLTGFEYLGDGTYLFQGVNDTETKTKMLNNNRVNLLESNVDELAKNLISTMTQQDPKTRISAAEAKNHLFFRDDEFHIQFLNSLNEALIELGDDTLKAREIVDALNQSYFMVFEREWQTLPFVIPDILGNKKYSGLLDAFLRYTRNAFQHMGQHKMSLKKHFQLMSISDETSIDTISTTITSTPASTETTLGAFLVTDNRVFIGPFGRSLCSFAHTTHSAHLLGSALIC